MSTVVLTVEERFERTPDGRVWTLEPVGRGFFARYLAVFDRVKVLGRVTDVVTPSPGAIEASCPGVAFTALPPYRGLSQFARAGLGMLAVAGSVVAPGDAVIVRVPSPIATLLLRTLRSRAIPYAVEVVGDPRDAFSPGAIRHPLRPFIRWKMTRDLERQAREAMAAAYVTRGALQRRYPCGSDGPQTPFVTAVSDVELGESAFVAAPPARPPLTRFTLVHVGSFTQLYKGQDVLIDAVRRVRLDGLDVDVVFVGGGRHLEEMRTLAERSGLGARVRFVGHLVSRAAVTRQLDAADLFVLPSRQEGLPRAMLEAMARGLACLGTTVGGVPELLDAADMVPPGDAAALAAAIAAVARDPQRLAAMRMRSLARAREFASDRLGPRRAEFYRHVRDAAARRERAA